MEYIGRTRSLQSCYAMAVVSPGRLQSGLIELVGYWASSQIRKIPGCTCAGPPPQVSDPDMHLCDMCHDA